MIRNIRNEIFEKEMKKYGKNISPDKVNEEIYARLFRLGNFRKESEIDDQFISTSLQAYVSTLDKTRIKTSEEYLKEVNDARTNLLVGSKGYMPPELYISLSKRRQLSMEKEKEPTVALKRILRPESDPPACVLEHNDLNELISKTYLKYMYNPEQLHSCRHLIEHKIISGETIDLPTAKHLRQIDNDLYQLYMDTSMMNNPHAFGVKRKSRKMFRKSRKINRKSKYVKKY
jgi:hypothetical protein